MRKGIEENIVKTKEYECDFRKQYSTPYGIDEIGSEKIKQKQQERDNNITILVQNIENYVEKQPEFLKNSMATIMHDLEWLIPKSR